MPRNYTTHHRLRILDKYRNQELFFRVGSSGLFFQLFCRLSRKLHPVSMTRELKGPGISCHVTLKTGEERPYALHKEPVAQLRREIAPIPTPDAIQWAPGLPKTRSGKIMRRILRKIAANETDQLGDTSTLADPAVVTDLLEKRVG